MADSQRRKPAPRTADGVMQAMDKRTELVRREVAAANAATDAKTARLKALRLEKEAQDAEAARLLAEQSPRPKSGKTKS